MIERDSAKAAESHLKDMISTASFHSSVCFPCSFQESPGVDLGEDQMDEYGGAEGISSTLESLRTMATDMGTEVEEQNKQLDRIGHKECLSRVARGGGGGFKLVHDSIMPPVWSCCFVAKFV